jgi:hypothetical protein
MKRSLSSMIILGLAAGLLAACTPPAAPQPAETQAFSPPTITPPASTPLPRKEPIAVPTRPALEPTGTAYPPQLVDPANLPPAVVAAEKALAKKLAIPTTEITIHSYDQTEWPNGCLGAEVSGEMCIQVITPGYLVILQVKDQFYEVHTNNSGSSVRIMPEFKKRGTGI